MSVTPSDRLFSSHVKAVQSARGSRDMFEARDADGGWPTKITADLARFISAVRTCYLATASAAGQPYVQHRGGPPGFLRVLDETTLGFADFKGNRQYITTGHLQENHRVHLFLMDYENQRRVKLWGTARVVLGDQDLTDRLFPTGYRARVEQVILIKLAAWDMNCAQHIPQMFHAADVAATVQTLQAKIDAMTAEIAALKAGQAG
jgi:uncharacterized protein